MVVAVTVVGSVMLLLLLGGAIFFALSAGGSGSAEADTSPPSEVASKKDSSVSKEKPSAKQNAQAPVRHFVTDLDMAKSSGSDGEPVPDSTDTESEDNSAYSDNDDPASDSREGDDADYSNQSPPSEPVSNPPRDYSDASASGEVIQLSLGVALPQTLATGTAIGFSATYEFTRGAPRSSANYFWVITNGQGQVAPIPVRLNRQGQLNTFIGWKKNQAPFSCHIEAVASGGKRRKISRELSLR